VVAIFEKGAVRAAPTSVEVASRHGRVLRGLGVLGLGAAALTVVSSAAMAHTITRPRRLRLVVDREIDDRVESLAFRTDDGLTLHGWYLSHPAPRDLIVVCHGFAMNRHELLDLARGLHERGHAIFLFDFRAHGASDGVRSTIGYREADDIVAAVAFLAQRSELASLPVGVIGVSMGGAAALMAAAREPRIAAVAADSAFATLHDIAAGGLRELYRLPAYPFTPLIVRFGELLTRARIRFNRPVDAVAAIAPRPLLLIHGDADTLIPLKDAHALYAAAGEPKELWIVPGVRHGSALAHDQDAYIRRLDHFFSDALAPARTIAV
jgi:alpha-beta hydrolase superfamily lysophospholipase